MSEKQVALLLPDGSKKQFLEGTQIRTVIAALGPRLAKAAVAGRVGEHLVDLDYILTAQDDGCAFAAITLESPEGLEIYRHTAAHIMAQATKRLFPEAKLAIGPAIENGFYYDFDLPRSLTPDDLSQIEAEMAKIVQEDLPLKREELTKTEAIAFFKAQKQNYKVELLADLAEDQVSIYRQGEFADLCRGPHLPSTKYLEAFKLLSVAGAYWRGDVSRPMLQRIYGTAFAKQSELTEYLQMLEEAAKRDHRKLGKELDLFSIHEEGPGFPFFHPKGMVLRNLLEDFWRQEHRRRGYQEVRTPIILNEELWHQSGHWDHYQENMYFTEIDKQRYAVKPMNCPGGMLLYKRKLHSYRELPIRLGELGLVHRHELSGVLHGLMRVRCFTQDDAHIFMLPSQIEAEIQGVIELIDYVYSIFGFTYHVELSTKPEKAMGSDEVWEHATSVLRQALEARGMDYAVNEGDGAFYGPKIDFHLRDSIGRTWQCGTIQLDFQMPEQFDLTYIGEDGQKHRPVMLHRVIFGSIERFIAILVEHFAGAFPLWLAPVQVKIIPVGEAQAEYAQTVGEHLAAAGLRFEVDDRNEKLGYRIREAQMEKVPYMLILGDKEKEAGTVSVRGRKSGDLGTKALAEFIAGLQQDVAAKSLVETS